MGFSGRLTDALFRWLSFQRFVQSGVRLDCPDGQIPPDHVTGWLQLWDAQSPASTNRSGTDWHVIDWHAIFFMGAALMGVVTMSGMLMVSLGEPINIWLPLLLFALLPLLLSFVTAALQWQQPGTGSWRN